MIKEILGFWAAFKKQPPAPDLTADIKGLSTLFAQLIPHAGMTLVEHAEILERWMHDPENGHVYRLRYASRLQEELAHAMEAIISPPSTIEIYEGAVRGPTFRDIDGHYMISRKPFPRHSEDDVRFAQSLLEEFCERLRINVFEPGPPELASETRAILLTEQMMIQLRRYGPHSRRQKLLGL